VIFLLILCVLSIYLARQVVTGYAAHLAADEGVESSAIHFSFCWLITAAYFALLVSLYSLPILFVLSILAFSVAVILIQANLDNCWETIHLEKQAVLWWLQTPKRYSTLFFPAFSLGTLHAFVLDRSVLHVVTIPIVVLGTIFFPAFYQLHLWQQKPKRFVLGRDPQGNLVDPDRSFFAHHAAIQGNPGAGKSQLILSLLKQSIERPDPDLELLAYIDAKGGNADPVVRNWLAENTPAHVPFYYLSTDENEESDHYDALESVIRIKNPNNQNNLLCARLGISLASSREKFFPHLNMALGLEAFELIEKKKMKLESFTHLHEILNGIRDKAGDRFKHATDILNRVKAVASCSRLVPRSGKKLIVASDLFERPTVLCVNLPVMEGSQQSQHIGRWLLGDLVMSAKRRRGLLFCDEAHHIFDSRETLLVAEQGRGFGLGIIIAAQSSDQFQTEDGRPLGWAFDKLCRANFQFSPNSPDDLKKLMVQSGLKNVVRTSHTVSNLPNIDNLTLTIDESTSERTPAT
jgi:hypothetical protein